MVIGTPVAFVNARIYVSFKPVRVVSGLLVANGRVVLASSSDHVIGVARSIGARIYDLGGRTVLPGFVDAHLHVDALGLVLRSLDLRGVSSIEELKARLREYSHRTGTKWVLGHGWDHELFKEKRWPTRWDLDEAVPNRPVLITRVCLHAGVVNTVGLLESRVLEQGVKGVVVDEKSVATGVLLEDALKHVKEYIREHMSIEDYAELIRVAQEHLVANGVTTAGILGCGMKTLKALFELWRRGELKVRFRVYVYAYEEGKPLFKELAGAGLKCGFGDEFLKVLGFKVFADGTLGARTAWLSNPYSDDPSNVGLNLTPVEEIAEIARVADESGLQMAVHAIGDKAVEKVLEVYRGLRNIGVLRHRIEHASMVRDDVLEELTSVKPVVVVQPRFIISDWWAVERVGLERSRWLYRFKSMLERGIPLALSTDAPVEPVNPWETVYAAVTRGVHDNVPPPVSSGGESISVVDALHLYTSGSAYAIHSECDVGGLEPGMLADFVIVDKDPLATPISELRSIKTLEVFVGGEKVWPT